MTDLSAGGDASAALSGAMGRGTTAPAVLPAPPAPSVFALLERLTATGERVMLGLTGPPGVGKTTYAASLVESWQQGGHRRAATVGLDGFHLGNETLAARGLADVKGAPETFDVDGFVALLRRLRAADEGAVPVPGFDRSREQTVPAATSVPATVELVVVEGNYLLLDGPWRPVRGLLDAVWFLDLRDDVRQTRLVDRHVAHGRTRAEAVAWVRRSDEPNARLVAASRTRADATVDVLCG